MFVLLTDVDTMAAHDSVIHVQSTFKGDAQFMTAVKIQISPTAVVDWWKEEIKSDGNCRIPLRCTLIWPRFRTPRRSPTLLLPL
jgi:hypothetical protein